jgi:hypothetical protein
MIMLTPEQEALKVAANSGRDLEFEMLVSHKLVSGLFTALEAARNAAGGLIPCAYRTGPVEFGAVKIEECGQIEGPPLWAVRKNGNCMSKDGRWEYEPMPSSRDDEFLARCRFASAQEAYSAMAARKLAEAGKGE